MTVVEVELVTRTGDEPITAGSSRSLDPERSWLAVAAKGAMGL